MPAGANQYSPEHLKLLKEPLKLVASALMARPRRVEVSDVGSYSFIPQRKAMASRTPTLVTGHSAHLPEMPPSPLAPTLEVLAAGNGMR